MRIGENSHRRKSFGADSKGFALSDLVAVATVLSALVLLMPPILGRNRIITDSTVCLDNLRVLTIAWQLYASENADRLVQNYQGGMAQGGAGASDPHNAPWAQGWEDWGTRGDNTNWLFIRSPRYARLSAYLSIPRNVHKCPSDIYLSVAQRAKGWKERVRSVSMNITVGDGNATQGPWNATYTQAKTMSAFIFPGPSENSLFLDEHPDSINDPALFPPNLGQWVDWPSNLHYNACNFTFADGHGEVHLWRSSLRRLPYKIGDALTTPDGSVGDPDLSWVSYHSQRVSAKSY